MTPTRRKYRVVTEPSARKIAIQDDRTWAEISAITIPDEPGLLAAVRRGIDQLLAEEEKRTQAEAPKSAPAKAETAAKKPAAKKSK